MLTHLKQAAHRLKSETLALNFAARDSRTPGYAKLLIVVVVAYAFSPIDLIPDFIPIIGLLDDIILIPLGVALALKLVPPSVMDECRKRASENQHRPVSRAAGIVVVAIWAALGLIFSVWLYKYLSGAGTD